MSTLDRVLAYLNSRSLWFAHDRHPLAYTATEVAAVEHMPPRNFAKTVVVHSPEGYAMTVLPADRRVDLDELRLALGVAHLRLANEGELQDLFGTCELGAMPPFGNETIYDIPVYVDGLLVTEEEIGFNAGTHRDVVRMRTEDWMDIVKPQVLAFATVTNA